MNTPRAATYLAWSDAALGHDTGDHVESPRRARAIRDRLTSAGLLEESPAMYVQYDPTPVLAGIHHHEYLQALERFAAVGGGWIDNDTYLASDTLQVARRAAGLACGAVQAVLDGAYANAFALGRPPGHHATPNRAMGFCFYNSIAAAAELAIQSGIERVAIVDWDVHHGNGTQEIFYERRDVLFVSVHQYPFYPGSGRANERGLGAGEGYTINLPLAAGAGDDQYLALFDDIIAPAVRAYGPELLLVSAGFDAHADDPLGGMRVTDRGFAALAGRAVALADEIAQGRIVAVLEGGYDVNALARCVEATARVFNGAAPDAAIAAQTTEKDR